VRAADSAGTCCAAEATGLVPAGCWLAGGGWRTMWLCWGRSLGASLRRPGRSERGERGRGAQPPVLSSVGHVGQGCHYAGEQIGGSNVISLSGRSARRVTVLGDAARDGREGAAPPTRSRAAGGDDPGGYQAIGIGAGLPGLLADAGQFGRAVIPAQPPLRAPGCVLDVLGVGPDAMIGG
jgi:hypothetical protein